MVAANKARHTAPVAAAPLSFTQPQPQQRKACSVVPAPLLPAHQRRLAMMLRLLSSFGLCQRRVLLHLIQHVQVHAVRLHPGLPLL